MATISFGQRAFLRGGGLGSRTWRWVRTHWLSLSIVAVMLYIIGVPLGYAVGMSFRDGTPANPGAFTLDNYSRAYSSPQTISALSNTLIYAIAVSLVSLSLAVLFAWLIERTDMPGRNFAWVAMLLPIAMPGMLASMAWILLLSGNIGIINIVLRFLLSVFGVDLADGPLNVYSLWGLIFVEGFRGSTALFLIMVAAFRLMDPAMEEAASISGARSRYMLRKITLPLMLPAVLAGGMYALIGNLDDLEAALLIGVPAGIFLLPTLIYFTAARNSDWGLSAAYTSLFLVLTTIMVIIYYVTVVRKTGKFATITGKAYRPRRISLGRWRYAALGVFIAYFVVTIALPVLVLLWASLLPIYQVPSWEAVGNISFQNYLDLPDRPGLTDAVWNTLLLGIGAATATMILAFLVSWLVVRQRIRGGLGLDTLAFIPHAVPSVAVGIALVAFYLNPLMRWTHIYGTILIMVLAMITRYITFASRTANSAMSQLNKELEEAAYISGVGKLRTLFRITFRLLSPAFIAGWIFVAATASRNLSIPLLLAGNDTQTLASVLYFYWYRNADFAGAAALGVCMILGLTGAAIFARRLISSGYTGAD